MKIIKRNIDGLVVATFSDDAALLIDGRGTLDGDNDLLLWEYTDENSTVIDQITLPEDYADFKYFHNDDGEFVVNDDYPVPPEIARQNEELAAQMAQVEPAPE